MSNLTATQPHHHGIRIVRVLWLRYQPSDEGKPESIFASSQESAEMPLVEALGNYFQFDVRRKPHRAQTLYNRDGVLHIGLACVPALQTALGRGGPRSGEQ